MNHHHLYDRHEGERRVGEIFLPFSKQEIRNFPAFSYQILCHIICNFCRRCASYITRKPNYLHGPAIRMDVRYDREIRREGHCYSERDQKGGRGALKRREGDIVTSRQDQRNCQKYQQHKCKRSNQQSAPKKALYH